MLQLKQHTLSGLLFISLLCAGIAHATQPQSINHQQSLVSWETPEGLSKTEWGSIQTQIQADQYKAYPDEHGGYNAANPAHGWQIHYGADGTTTLTPRNPEASAYQLGLSLSAIGYQTLQVLSQPPTLSQHDKTLTYQWTDTVQELWVNSSTDLEQWFILQQRPPGVASGVPLTVKLSLDTDLKASQFGNSIRIVDSTGITSITYNKLKVWDATGKTLTAKMQLEGQQLSLIIDDHSAHYPLTIDPRVQQQAYLKASNIRSRGFGAAIAIAGDTLVVGNIPLVAGAYVFSRDSLGVWSQQAYLKASNPGAKGFGSTVAIVGNTLVVGARQEDYETVKSARRAGAAYVFTRDGLGIWSQQAHLKASNPGRDDNFGSAVAVTDDTVVVGASGEDSNASGVNGNETDNSSAGSGAAYVFTRDGLGVWSQQAYLKASNTKASNTGVPDIFGNAVSISGDTLVVGASGEDSNASGVNGDETDSSAVAAGAVYVFTRDGLGVWRQQAYLKASNTDADDFFGIAVAIAGDTLVVGATGEDSNASGVNGDETDNSFNDPGAAYVFTRDGLGVWSQQAYLKASNTGATDFFGNTVAIAGDTLVVGASHEDSNASGVNGDETDNSANAAGAAYVFTRDGLGTWSQQAYLKASNTGATDRFGDTVAIAGDTLVVGATGEDSNASGVNGDETNNSAVAAGAAYVFTIQAVNNNVKLTHLSL